MSEPVNMPEDQVQMSEEEIHEKRLEELDRANSAPEADLRLLFDTLTHCSEPADAEAIYAKLGGEAESTNRVDVARASPTGKEKAAAEKEHAEGVYRVTFNARHYPEKHRTWGEDFQLHVNEKDDYFYVLQSNGDQPEKDKQVYSTNFVPDNQETRIGEFGFRYECGSRARDKNNNIIGKENDQIEFNYAEHKMMGEMLHLRWSKTDTTLGTRELKLPNDVNLSYGEINGLGGDFFGGYDPVSNGNSLEEQCKFFRQAFDTLGNGSKQLVGELLSGRKAEVDAVTKAVAGGQSTFQAYKELKGPNISGLSRDDIYDQVATMSSAGPSYLRLAQINFDHFGQDAVTAYNAGHYCALQEAAGGNLELAYAMNAFADHYLGDCFASGHFRTPRRTLHGSTTALGAAWDAVSGMVQTGGFVSGAMKIMAPDLLSMLMHNEDNKRGIVVANKAGQEFSIWGDKQLFEPQNEKNKEMMRQALQASVDEVYEAYDTKAAKRPADGSGYRAWNYAPSKTVDSKSHSPLFITYDLSWWEKVKLYWPVKVREPFSDPFAKNYTPVGGSAALIELYEKISSSEQWKNY